MQRITFWQNLCNVKYLRNYELTSHTLEYYTVICSKLNNRNEITPHFFYIKNGQFVSHQSQCGSYITEILNVTFLSVHVQLHWLHLLISDPPRQ